MNITHTPSGHPRPLSASVASEGARTTRSGPGRAAANAWKPLGRRVWFWTLAATGSVSAVHAASGGSPNAAGLLVSTAGVLLLTPSFTALGLLILALLPDTVGAVRNAIVGGRGRCLRAGILSFAAVLLVLAAARNSGGPLAAAALVVLALALAVGLPAVGLLVGHSLLQHAWPVPNALASAAAGLLLIGMAAAIPVLGWGFLFFFSLMALGGVVVAARDRRKARPQPSDREEEPPPALSGGDPQ
ncbi:MAG: hypothetical protein QHJ73_13765 [Armatimonadota bacterium]|nr:hypothetical protein [Armatimonadota bacterium]